MRRPNSDPTEQTGRGRCFGTNFDTSTGFECGCVCPQTGQICSYSLILLCSVLCGVFGSVPLGRASRACLGCPCCGWPLPVRFSCGFLPWRCGAPLFRCCCSGLSWWGCRLVFACPRGLGACGLARFLLVPPPSPSPLVVCNGPVAIPLAWRVVGDWLLSSLRFMATKAALSPCCGCCSCTPRSGTEVFALG